MTMHRGLKHRMIQTSFEHQVNGSLQELDQSQEGVLSTDPGWPFRLKVHLNYQEPSQTCYGTLKLHNKSVIKIFCLIYYILCSIDKNGLEYSPVKLSAVTSMMNLDLKDSNQE